MQGITLDGLKLPDHIETLDNGAILVSEICGQSLFSSEENLTIHRLAKVLSLDPSIDFRCPPSINGWDVVKEDGALHFERIEVKPVLHVYSFGCYQSKEGPVKKSLFSFTNDPVVCTTVLPLSSRDLDAILAAMKDPSVIKYAYFTPSYSKKLEYILNTSIFANVFGKMSAEEYYSRYALRFNDSLGNLIEFWTNVEYVCAYPSG